LHYAPVPSSGWSIGVIFPKNELTEDIIQLSKTVIFLGIAGILLLLIAVILNTSSITKQLRSLSQAAERIGTGNLDIELPSVQSGDEVGKLTAAFNYMKTSLGEYIAQLKETTAAKERIESELKIAHDIQMNLLPKTFPPFPDRPEIDIDAAIKPAREVGGDFYDFFLIDRDHLCFVIADVSDKGIPAALFMVITKTLLKAVAALGMNPGEILNAVNRELCKGNDATMFVTIFCSILNIRTGEIHCANAGHNPPLIVRTTGDVAFITARGDIVAGVLEDVRYQTERLFLQPGDFLFLYTDGVTEAVNEAHELFSEERLHKSLTAMSSRPVRDIIPGIVQEIERFSMGMQQQTDDITMMIVQYRGKNMGIGGDSDLRQQ
jgi:phosphoserine phosphatase RsbU/P